MTAILKNRHDDDDAVTLPSDLDDISYADAKPQ